jgi:hypothetical protein
MAKKPGAFDLRCDEAVLSAMLAHPEHGKRLEFLEWGEAMVRAVSHPLQTIVILSFLQYSVSNRRTPY